MPVHTDWVREFSHVAILVYPHYRCVQSDVTNDYKTDEKRRLFNEKGESLQAELKTKIVEGIDFDEAAKALGLGTASFDTFSVQEAPRELSRSALQNSKAVMRKAIK